MKYAELINSIGQNPYEYGEEESSSYPQFAFHPVSTIAKMYLLGSGIRFGTGVLGALGGFSRISATADRSKYSAMWQTLWAPGRGIFKWLGMDILYTGVETLDVKRTRQKLQQFTKRYRDVRKAWGEKSPVETAREIADLVRNPFDRSRLTARFYDSIFGTKATYEKYAKTNKLGFLDNKLIVPSDYHTVMRDILPDEVYRAVVGDLDTILKKSISTLPYKEYDRMAKAISRGKYSEYIKDMELSGKVAPKHIVWGDIEEHSKGLFDSLIPKRLRDIRLIGRWKISKGSFSVRLPWKLRAAIGGEWRIREANMMATAVYNAAQEAAKRVPGSEAMVQELFEKNFTSVRDYALRYVNRVGMGRFVKLVTAGYFLKDIIPFAAGEAAKAALSVPQRLSRQIHRAVTPEFGRELIMSSRMATERQRAVAAIQNSEYNARYLLGNEASLYH